MVSKFHLVDLAGSERQKKTKAEGDRLKEGECNLKKYFFIVYYPLLCVYIYIYIYIFLRNSS